MTHHTFAPGGFVKIFSTQNGVTHVQSVGVDVVSGYTVGEEPSFTPNVGSDVLMSVAVDAYITLLKPIFGPDTSFNQAEYWSKPTDESDPVWVFTHPIGEVGTGSTASADMLQAVMSFRTALGGLFRLYFMEISGDVPVNFRTSWPFGAGPYLNLANYLVGDDGWIIGKDNGALVVPIYFTSKYNDALRKKRMLI